MADKLILMQGWGVRAILDGTKRQTRRVRGLNHINAQPEYWFGVEECKDDMGFCFTGGNSRNASSWDESYVVPPYEVGDRLGVKETWQIADTDGGGSQAAIAYRAYDAGDVVWVDVPVEWESRVSAMPGGVGWRPSIFMPKWAIRRWLEVTDVRCQRVQDITKADTLAEGCRNNPEDFLELPGPRYIFLQRWDEINAKPKPQMHNLLGEKEKCYVSYPWADIQETRTKNGLPWYVAGNPWVFAYTFEVAQGGLSCQ